MNVQYQIFRSSSKSWNVLFTEASEFASKLDDNQLINISHSCDHKREGVVVVWYFATDELEQWRKQRGRQGKPNKRGRSSLIALKKNELRPLCLPSGWFMIHRFEVVEMGTIDDGISYIFNELANGHEPDPYSKFCWNQTKRVRPLWENEHGATLLRNVDSTRWKPCFLSRRDIDVA